MNESDEPIGCVVGKIDEEEVGMPLDDDDDDDDDDDEPEMIRDHLRGLHWHARRHGKVPSPGDRQGARPADFASHARHGVYVRHTGNGSHQQNGRQTLSRFWLYPRGVSGPVLLVSMRISLETVVAMQLLCFWSRRFEVSDTFIISRNWNDAYRLRLVVLAKASGTMICGGRIPGEIVLQ